MQKSLQQYLTKQIYCDIIIVEDYFKELESMNSKSIREDARLYFLPVILGNGKTAHHIAHSLYKRYGTVSYIVADKRSPRDLLGLYARSVILPSEEHPHLFADALIDLCRQNPYTLPILIPAEPRYADAADGLRKRLEPYFVFSDPEHIFTDSPMTRAPQK